MKIQFIYLFLFITTSCFAQLGDDVLIDDFVQTDQVIFADVNGDGLKDLISPEVRYYPQQSNKKFGEGIDVIREGISVWTGDLNMDNYIDLVVTYADSTVYLQNLGDGIFGSPIVIYQDEVSHVYFGDFNFDGTTDIAIDKGWFYFDAVTTSFGDLQELSDSGRKPQLADLNGDDLPDVVLERNGIIYQMLNDGEDSFENEEQIGNISDDPIPILLSDIDSDGDIDILSHSPTVSYLFRNDGNGDFSLRQTIFSELVYFTNEIIDQTLGDLNNDGRIDIVAQLEKGIVWIPQNEDGEYNSGLALYEFDHVGFIFAGDLNLDGKTDLIFNNENGVFWSENETLSPENANNTGNIGEHQIVNNLSTNSINYVVEDIDGDGLKDWIIAFQDGLYWRRRLAGKDKFGALKIIPKTTTYSSQSTEQPQIADKDGDGDGDLFYRRAGNLTVSEYDENTGEFVGQEIWLPSDSISINFKVADFNNDGHLDVLGTGSFRLWLNDGNDNLSSTLLHTDPEVSSSLIKVTDFDEDGDLDIMVSLGGDDVSGIFYYRNEGNSFVEIDVTPDSFFPSGSVVELYGDNNFYMLNYFVAYLFDPISATFATTGMPLSEFTSNPQGSFVDYDLDGDMDLIDVDYEVFGNDKIFRITENNGSTFLEETPLFSTIKYYEDSPLQVADFTNDGVLDFIQGSRVFEGLGLDNEPPYQEHSALLSGFQVVDYGDVDGDGDEDLLMMRGGDYPQLGWSENYNNNGDFSTVILIDRNMIIPSSARWFDFDEDGDLDAIVSNRIFLNDGNGNFSTDYLHPDGGGSVTPNLLNTLADIDGDGFNDNFKLSSSALTYRIFNPSIDDFGNSVTLTGLSFNSAIEPVFDDLDEDGDIDFLVVGASGEVLFIENQAGTFSTPFIPVVGQLSTNRPIVLADVNIDGLLDLIYFESIAGQYNLEYLKYLPGLAGAELFGTPRNIGNLRDIGNTKLIVEDLNADGLPDIAVNGYWFAQTTNEEEEFIGRIDLGLSPNNAFGNLIGLHDFNNDGYMDVLQQYGWSEVKIEGQTATVSGDKQILNMYAGTADDFLMTQLDFDLDGDLDILTAVNKDLYWMENVLVNGKSEFQPAVSFLTLESNSSIQNFQAKDMNGDGLKDLVIAQKKYIYWMPHSTDSLLRFQQLNYIDYSANSSAETITLFAKDLDLDGDMDLLKVDDFYSPYMLINDGGEVPVFEKISFPVSLPDENIAFFNVPDAPVGNLYGKHSGSFYQFTHQGSLSFSSFGTNTPNNVDCNRAIGMKDLDMDNQTDFTYFCDDVVKVLFDNSGSFVEVNTSELSGSIRDVWLIDLNNDYLVDIMARGTYDDEFYISLQESPRQFGDWTVEPFSTHSSSDNMLLMSGDYDQDFDVDIAFITERWVASGPKAQSIYWKKNFTNNPVITGRSYFDENENAIKDEAEINLKDFKFTLAPENIQTFSSETGEAAFYVEPGSYELSIELPFLWELSTETETYEIDVEPGLLDSQIVRYYGLIPTIEHIEAESFTSSALMRCFRDVPFWLSYKNTGTEVISGDYVFVKNPATELLEVSVQPDTIIGDSLIWHFENLYPTYSQEYQLLLTMPDETFFGQSIGFESSILAIDDTSQDTTQLGVFNYAENLICAIDPNDKRVQPSRIDSLEQNYTLFEEELFYTIRFQNTGNDTAFNIVILDQLDENLDWETFSPIHASHDYYVTLDENGLVSFDFRNILLVDSLTNEPESHGFVMYSISPIMGLEENTAIENTAAIYFDFNEPIITNTTESTMVSTLDFLNVANENTAADFVEIYPNPIQNTDLLTVNSFQKKHLFFRLLSATGLEIKTWESYEKEHPLDIKGIMSGIYFLEITEVNNPRNALTEKLIVIN